MSERFGSRGKARGGARPGAGSPFLAGVKAAVPVWVAFVPTSFAMGIAAKVHGLSLGEIVLMSMLVYAGPAQFAALEPLATGRPALQILVTTLLINLRFLIMSAALARYFRGVKRALLMIGAQFISASSFIIPFAHFQKQAIDTADAGENCGEANFRFFLGVALTNFTVWVTGSAIGYWAAFGIPAAFDEALKFVLPGYFACLLAVEIRERIGQWVGVASFLVAMFGMTINPDWGWLVTALVVASAGWMVGQWTQRAS